MFYRSLGKDAEGIAVLAFIELVLQYKGADFENWPGLARCKVHFAVFDAMQKQGRIWENETQTDTDSEAGIALLETGCAAGERLDELARFFTFTGTAGSAAAVKCRTEENTDAAVFR